LLLLVMTAFSARVLVPLILAAVAVWTIWLELRGSPEARPRTSHDLTKHLPEDVQASAREHAILRGYVSWPRDKPAAGASVFLRASNDPTGQISPQEATTDADGFFRIEDVWPALYTLDAVVWGPLVPRRRAIGCAHLDRVDSLAFELRLTLVPQAPIRGSVLDSLGRPMPGIEVSITHPSAILASADAQDIEVSDGAGRFEVWAPSGAFVNLEGWRQEWFQDLRSLIGPPGWASAVRSGCEHLDLYMPSGP
jgi:hypothetical protein